MATSRPTSMIIPPSVFDETNGNESKNALQKKDSQPIRSTNQQELPANYLISAHSSSSSIDSAGARKTQINEKNSLPQINSIATISSTTTDSDLDSEQEERYNDDNNISESTNLSNRIDKQKLTKCDSGQQKSETNNQDRLSRRIKHFQKLFKSEIAHDDMPELIDSYVCAYQGDILLQGKMYITGRYLCFHSRIISYVTKHVYQWEQIENVTKERVAFIFPTAIGIQLKTTGKKIIYASFLQRDQAYDKILLMCSRFNTDVTSLQDDEDDSIYTQNGTLKANHHNQEKIKKSKRDQPYEVPNETEQNEVLQLCLKPDKSTCKMRKNKSVSSKSSDDKQSQQQSKKQLNSSDKKNLLLAKKSKADDNVPNRFNENSIQTNQAIQHSSLSKNQQISSDTALINTSVTSYRQSHQTHSHSCDETLSPTNRLSTNSSSRNSNTDLNSSSTISTNETMINRCIRFIHSSIISILKIIIAYLLLIYNQFKTYPIKTSLILLIFIFILIIHSFYLIKLAYRIENRLQSLHHKWASSTMKTSLSSSL